MIFGRAISVGEVSDGALELQRIARLIGVLQTFIRMSAHLFGLAPGRGLCQNNSDPNVVLGSFIAQLNTARGDDDEYTLAKSPLAAGDPDVQPSFYTARNDLGESLLVTSPPGSNILLVDEDENETLPFGNLQEVVNLNTQGVLPDLGNVSDRRIVAQNTELGSRVDVTSVVINICGQTSASSAETNDAEEETGIMDWKDIANSVFSGKDQRPVILFDGMCNLCNGGVNFALDYDDVGKWNKVR